MSHKYLVGCVPALLVVAIASAQTTAPADPTKALLRSHLDTAAALYQSAILCPTVGDDSRRNVEPIAVRLMGVDAMNLAIDGQPNAVIAALMNIQDDRARQTQAYNVLRIYLLLQNRSDAQQVRATLSGENTPAATTNPQESRKWATLNELAGQTGTPVAAGVRRRGRKTDLLAIEALPDPVKGAATQSSATGSWQPIEDIAHTLSPSHRTILRTYEAHGRMKAGDVVGAELAARLAVEASTGYGSPPTVALTGMTLAQLFSDAGLTPASRRICARAAVLTMFCGNDLHTSPDGLAELAIAQHEHGDLSWALAWIARVPFPNARQSIYFLLADHVVESVVGGRATAPLAINLANVDVPVPNDGFFEGKNLDFWIDFATRRAADHRYLSDRYGKDAITAALSGVGKPALPVLIEQVRAVADVPDPTLLRGQSLPLACIGADAVPPLIDILRTTPQASRRAIGALGSIGSPAVAPLIAIAKDRDKRVRCDVSNALANLAQTASPNDFNAITTALDSLVTDPDLEVRTATFTGVDQLAEVLRNRPEAWVKAATATAVVHPIQTLAKGLSDADSMRRIQAANLLAKRGDAPQLTPLLPILIGALNDSEPEVRKQAIFAIMKVGPAAEPAIVPLTDWRKLCLGGADNQSPGLAKMSADALAAIGPKTATVLLNQLDSDDEFVRQSAITALRVAKPNTVESQFDRFTRLLADPERGWWVVERIGTTGARAIPLTLELLRSDDRLMREYGVNIACRIALRNPDPRMAAAIVDMAIAHPDDALAEEVRVVAGFSSLLARVKKRTDPPATYAVLLELLAHMQTYDLPEKEVTSMWRGLYENETDPARRQAAVTGYMLRVRPANPGEPNLKPLKDSDPAIRLLAVNLYAKGSFELSDFVVESMAPLLNDPDREVQLSVARVSRRISGGHPVAEAKLVEMLSSFDELFRLRALDVLSERSRCGAETVNAVLKCASDPSAKVRAAAARTVNELSIPEGTLDNVRAAITPLLNDRDASVRREAALYLFDINDRAASAKAYLESKPKDARLIAAARVRCAPPNQCDALARKIIADTKPPALRAEVFELLALSDLSHPKKEPLFVEALNDPSPIVRSAALAVIVKTQRPHAYYSDVFQPVSLLLLDADPKIRMEALKVLDFEIWGSKIVRPIKAAWLKYANDAAFRDEAAWAIYQSSRQMPY